MCLVKRLVPFILVVAGILSLMACASSETANITSPIATDTSDSQSTSPLSVASAPGKITAIASGITGQNDKIYAVMAYNYDWQPGAQEPWVAGLNGYITGNDFSFSGVLRAPNAQSGGGISAEDYVFTPGTYSVVFFISAQNTPPQYFAEVRVMAKGDTEAKAPAWSSWTHQ